MTRRVVVTGLGLISALGDTAEAAVAALEASRSGLGPITILETRHRGEFAVGEVRRPTAELAAMAGAAEGELGRTALLGIIAAREAAASAGLAGFGDAPTGLVSATTAAGMDLTERLHSSAARPEEFRTMIETHDCGHSTERIADALGLRGPLATVSTACTSAANAILVAARLVRAGVLDRAFAGGCDALCRFVVNGFHSLRIVDPLPCRPFDDGRNGLTIGEGAGFLVLEAEETAARRGARGLAELRGWGVTNDLFHQTASSPQGDGAAAAMRAALAAGGVGPQDVGWVSAHGTGTENNDLSEGRALLRVFGERPPPFGSTKGATGHAMGAAGAVEAVICVLALARERIYPSLNFRTPMRELGLVPATAPRPAPGLAHVLSNSLGFGGNCTSLLFSRS